MLAYSLSEHHDPVGASSAEISPVLRKVRYTAGYSSYVLASRDLGMTR